MFGYARLARWYCRCSPSDTVSSQRDSSVSNPPSPSTKSSLLISTGPSWSRSIMPRRRRSIMTHMRKSRRRKRNVESTISSGKRMYSASRFGWFPACCLCNVLCEECELNASWTTRAPAVNAALRSHELIEAARYSCAIWRGYSGVN